MAPPQQAIVLECDGTAGASAYQEAINPLPDSFWDHIVKGAEVQDASAKPGAHKRLDGELANYQLRIRQADPAELGVDKVKQLSGYLDDDQQDKHLFYWFFESRNDPAKDPVVLWLNGGPGCSSFVGLFDELGPATIPRADLGPVNNPYSWNSNASVIFIDQPVNVGFSYGSNITKSSQAAAKDIYAMLTLFFHQFPNYAERDFFVTGESYAGHYIPAIGAELLSHNNSNINLKGLAIGNGLTDPYIQYLYYRPTACGQGGYPAVLSPSDCQAMMDAEPECQRLIGTCYDNPGAKVCWQATTYCNRNVMGIYRRNPKNNVYDITSPVGTGKTSYASQFLSSNRTKQALGVEASRAYLKCNYKVYDDFVGDGDWMKPAHRVIPGILEKIPVLIYAGDIDYICNWLGNQAWTLGLEWPGKSALNAAKPQELRAKSGKNYGNVRAAQGLSLMQIYKAGHMVPEYEGEGSLDFLNRFMGGEWSSKAPGAHLSPNNSCS
ncbi:carboxypeptidase Y precursor [Metarhizium acridum CQMa 102]|uniref:Carboxypeptidase n=1 Tax=Metarhizium acridum (strain CQMa 102) TaxID=655827 RepID=E9DZB8_METAQ|nr:carboxypeptidase Y precursor [Metarhizium acridum CQMa 102]EFY91080.1 carboxypeptidase Y precursor [Metarhizium acridum CQMa 102]